MQLSQVQILSKVSFLFIIFRAFNQHQDRIKKIKRGEFFTKDQDPLAHYLKENGYNQSPVKKSVDLPRTRPKSCLRKVQLLLNESEPTLKQTLNDSNLLKQRLERDIQSLPFPSTFDNGGSFTKVSTKVLLRSNATVRRKQVLQQINIENDRLAHAILNKKSEFSREQMDKDWWQKVLPVKRFQRMSRRPFKIEKIQPSHIETNNISQSLSSQQRQGSQKKFRIRFISQVPQTTKQTDINFKFYEQITGRNGIQQKVHTFQDNQRHKVEQLNTLRQGISMQQFHHKRKRSMINDNSSLNV